MIKNIVLYLAGLLTGIVLMLLLAALSARNSVQNNENENTSIEEYPGITIFDQPADTIQFSRFEVSQVLREGMALARCRERQLADIDLFTGPEVLLIDENKYYYDGEIVDVPQGMQALHVGVYQYQTNRGVTKTVPVIRIR